MLLDQQNMSLLLKEPGTDIIWRRQGKERLAGPFTVAGT